MKNIIKSIIPENPKNASMVICCTFPTWTTWSHVHDHTISPMIPITANRILSAASKGIRSPHRHLKCGSKVTLDTNFTFLPEREFLYRREIWTVHHKAKSMRKAPGWAWPAKLPMFVWTRTGITLCHGNVIIYIWSGFILKSTTSVSPNLTHSILCSYLQYWLFNNSTQIAVCYFKPNIYLKLYEVEKFVNVYVHIYSTNISIYRKNSPIYNSF